MTDTKAAIAEIKTKLANREWRMDNLYHIRNKDGDLIQFVRNESQRMFWFAMWFLNIILKDRQRGFSTLIVIFMLDSCLFNSGTECGIIDISLPDAKKKLAKARLAYENLPKFIKDAVPLVTDAKETLAWANGSSISVSTSYRGGTLQILHISEMGKIACRFPERAREIRTGALNAISQGNIIFNESTAEGNSGEFYEDCQTARETLQKRAKLTAMDFKFHFFAWWMGTENEMDPEGIFISKELEEYFEKLEKEIGHTLSDRKRAWYAKKEAQQKDDMKREYPGTPDEAFEAAVEGVYLSKQLEQIRKRGQITTIPVDPGYPLNTGWDYGLSDVMTIWIHQRVGFVDRLVGYLSGTDDDVLYYWAKLNRDYAGVWGYHFLPHDFAHRRGGTANDAASPPKTLEEILNDAGMRDTYIVPRIDQKTTAIAEVRGWIPKAFFDEKNCEKGIKCLQNFRHEWDELNGCFKDRPRHDWACLPAGVKIQTPKGSKSVELFKPGDTVSICGKTAKVARAQQVGVRNIIELYLSSRVIIRCSADHKIFTSEGLVQAKNIEPGMVLLTEKDITQWSQSNLGIRAAFIESSKGLNIGCGAREVSTLVKLAENKKCCTGFYGKHWLVRYQRHMQSFLSMMIGRTLALTTGYADLTQKTVNLSPLYTQGRHSMGSHLDLFHQPDTTGRIQSSFKDMCGNSTTDRSNQGMLFTTSTTTDQTIQSKTLCARLRAIIQYIMPKKMNGLEVKRILKFFGLQEKKLSVLSTKLAGKETVYDIEVEHDHAYILSESKVATSNCHGYDGLESLVRGLNAYGTKGKVGIVENDEESLPPPPNWRA